MLILITTLRLEQKPLRGAFRSRLDPGEVRHREGEEPTLTGDFITAAADTVMVRSGRMGSVEGEDSYWVEVP